MNKFLATLFFLSLLPVTAMAADACSPLLQHEFKRLPGGKMENLCHYQGKVLLVVNTASYCGYTDQFDDLQKVYELYKDQGFVVLGFPSNDFGGQEPGQGKTITDFCRVNYGVDFPMYEKSPVKGAAANAFYKALKTATNGDEPRWNFHKYLIDTQGQVQAFPSRVAPQDPKLLQAIERALGAKTAEQAR
jgi:glutathione peroxidase